MRIPLSLLALLQFGCATISAGTSQEFTVTSNVRGAEVYFNGKSIGKTPLTTKVPKKKVGLVEVKMEGYESATANIDTKLNGWFWGNICTGGTFGSSTDAATGAMWEYNPDSFYANLRPAPGPARATPVLQPAAAPAPPEVPAPGTPEAPAPAAPPQTLLLFPPSAASLEARWEADSRIRYFVLMNFDSIAKDVARGDGEYLAALEKLMRRPHEPALVRELRGAFAQSTDAVDFSDRVLGATAYAARN